MEKRTSKKVALEMKKWKWNILDFDVIQMQIPDKCHQQK